MRGSRHPWFCDLAAYPADNPDRIVLGWAVRRRDRPARLRPRLYGCHPAAAADASVVGVRRWRRPALPLVDGLFV
ncbi:hypothetical protein FRAHR75_1160004 [Frankia sp. Hr75.2]|nr:hypothetical protein FRAHR75_1160004 [Frankia sp. Hr75.2]